MEDFIEMDDFRHQDEDNQDIQETSLDTEQDSDLNLPNVPLNIEESKIELAKTSFVSDARTVLKISKNVDPKIYRNLSFDDKGRVKYKGEYLTQKKTGHNLTLYSPKTLMKNPISREFLKLIGYDPNQTQRDLETVSSEQTEVVKTKLRSFKITENWARKEKDKATRELQETTDENNRKKLEESIQYFDQMEIQAKRRYKELEQNQFKRIDSIIKDKDRSLLERIKELFRRDGLTIGALITAIGMTISTIVLAVSPTNSQIPSKSNNNYIDKIKTFVKKKLVKLANFILDLAKKALTALPGIIGGLVSTLLKKGAEFVLFLSEHLIILLLGSIIAIFEIYKSKKFKLIRTYKK